MYQSDIQHDVPALQDKLAQLYGLARDKAIDLSFRPPFTHLLEKLGNPHLKLPPVIHVAGTNGKGSVVAMLRSILEAHGKRVHAYTSPHLIHFNERIVLAGQEISNDALEPLLDEVLALNAGADITFFEITTALAFKAFADSPADYLLLEVGLGGRLDCTNIIPTSHVSIITRIGMDHMEHLGDTPESIAAEKAGIMKKGVPCVIGAQKPEADKVILEHAAEMGVRVFEASDYWDTELPLPALGGAHQVYNAQIAVAAAKIIAPEITYETLADGLKHTQWRARMQRLNYSAAPEFEIWLDGGHNADAAEALAAHIQNWGDQPLYIILGMMSHKDPRAFVTPLLKFATEIHVVDIPHEPKSLKAAQIQAFSNDIPIFDGGDFKETLAALIQKKPGRILICGSLYLAGHVLQTLNY